MKQPPLIARRALVLALAVGALMPAMNAARAADWPTRPVRILVGAPPGGTADIVARLYARELQGTLGQTVFVDYKQGAGGTIAVQSLLSAPRDGYTFLLIQKGIASEVPHAIKVSYDPFKDIVPVAQLTRQGLIFVGSPGLPAKNLAELVTYIKAHPGKVDYANFGIGTRGQTIGVQFNRLAGLELKSGESVFINGASGGVGMAAIMIASAMGARPVIASSRSAEKLERLAGYGMDVGINASTDSQLESIRAATDGRGVDVIMDMIGGTAFPDHIRSLAVKGRLVNLARLGGAATAEVDINLLWLNRLKLIGVTFRTRSEQERIDCIQACARDLLPYFRDGKLRLPVDRTFDMDAIGEAYAYIERSQHMGKIVLIAD